MVIIPASQLAEFRDFAEEMAEAAAAAIQPYFRGSMEIHDKGGTVFDPVTLADREAERVMRRMISDRYPDHGILGEEEGELAGSIGLTWVLDPIDGTRAFITGLPLWGTLIGLNDGERPVLGVMNQPFTGERYIGTPEGAWCNGMQLAVRSCPELSKARVMCTTPAMFADATQRHAFEAIAAEAQLVRYGGDCYAYCMVAAGFVDVVIEAGLQPYDVQALIPIIEGAGGKMTSWDGSSAQHGGAVLACGDSDLHAKLIERLRHAI